MLRDHSRIVLRELAAAKIDLATAWLSAVWQVVKALGRADFRADCRAS